VVPQGVTGVYCIKLAFDPSFGTGDGTGASGNGTVAMVDIPATNCGTALPGASATVYVANGAGTSINDDFTVLFGGFETARVPSRTRPASPAGSAGDLDEKQNSQIGCREPAAGRHRGGAAVRVRGL
jgi:hypothetical protein